VGRRRRWSEEEKARIVAESLDPATTSSAVARRYGLHANQLFVWRQQLQRSVSSAETIAAPGFMPVLLAEDDATSAEAAGRMEIAVGLAVVRVGADVDGPEAGPARRRGRAAGRMIPVGERPRPLGERRPAAAARRRDAHFALV
jgi:transposase